MLGVEEAVPDLEVDGGGVPVAEAVVVELLLSVVLLVDVGVPVWLAVEDADDVWLGVLLGVHRYIV